MTGTFCNTSVTVYYIWYNIRSFSTPPIVEVWVHYADTFTRQLDLMHQDSIPAGFSSYAYTADC